MTIKAIYLARRNPLIAAEDFPARWKAHAALAGGFPAIRRRFLGVAQCNRVLEQDLLPTASTEYDGVNLMPMLSREAAETIYDDLDAVNTMMPDELRVFSDYVA